MDFDREIRAVKKMRMTEEDGKLFLYRFDHPLAAAEAVPIKDSDDMVRVIERAMRLKETITITDELDCLVFRCERGIVNWPRIRE